MKDNLTNEELIAEQVHQHMHAYMQKSDQFMGEIQRQMREDNAALLQQISNLTTKVSPTVDFFNNITFTQKFIMNILKIISALGGAVLVIYAFLIWLRN